MFPESKLTEATVISCTGNQIIAALPEATPPKPDAKVLLAGKRWGTVADVIGNVEKPYVVAKPDRNRKTDDSLIGKTLHFR